MGSGVSSSSTVRLRKAIVIRAYNLRKSDETLDEQFRPYAKRDHSNKLTITLGDVKKCLQLDDGALWTSIEELFSHCMGISVRFTGRPTITRVKLAFDNSILFKYCVKDSAFLALMRASC